MHVTRKRCSAFAEGSSLLFISRNFVSVFEKCVSIQFFPLRNTNHSEYSKVLLVGGIPGGCSGI